MVAAVEEAAAVAVLAALLAARAVAVGEANDEDAVIDVVVALP